MNIALEIIKREIAQRELANKHNHLRKDEVAKEIESLEKVVKIISSNLPVSGSLPNFEYEMFFKSEPNDFCKIDGWYPIATDRIRNPERIEKYIENGLLRKIRQ